MPSLGGLLVGLPGFLTDVLNMCSLKIQLYVSFLSWGRRQHLTKEGCALSVYASREAPVVIFILHLHLLGLSFSPNQACIFF